MKRREEKRLPITGYVAATMYETIEKIAEEEERSIAYLVNLALVEFVQRRRHPRSNGARE